MRKQRKIVIVSLNGMKPVGGVERVVFYLYDILSKNNCGMWKCVEILQCKFSLGKLNLLVYPILFSLRLFFMRNKMENR